jgi:ABC transport system ATP-binding/permease protein
MSAVLNSYPFKNASRPMVACANLRNIVVGLPFGCRLLQFRDSAFMLFMNLLSVESLSKSFGEQILFQNVSFGVSKGQKVALVARNGAGKTTLLKILNGLESPDSGTVAWRSGIKKTIVPQEPVLNEQLSIIDELLATDDPVQSAIREYEMALSNADGDPKGMESALEKMESLNAWDFESRVKVVLDKLNLHPVHERIANLSGGQRKRVALAKALVYEPDFLILDEPTNHLDIEMIEWLQDYLGRQSLSLLIITHDRYFLDSICTQIIEIEDQGIYTYEGNYGYYLEKRAEREFKTQRELEKANNLFRNELEWMRRQPKARTTKSKAREDSFYQIEEKVNSQRVEQELVLNVKMTRIGSKILDFKKVTKSYGDKLILKGFSYTFKRGERVGIVGRNGVGKSTFLNIIAGTVEPDGGKVEIGETIVLGYFKQDGLDYKPHHRVIDVVKSYAEVIELADGQKVTASQLLYRFQFDHQKQHSMVDLLSGGEKRRLHLLTVLIQNPNLLILDEPTNDLDLITLNILEEFLVHYPGALIIVSHDRYFLDKLVHHLLIFEGDGVVKDFNGNYREWRWEQDAEEKAAQKANQHSAKSEKASSASADSDKEKRKLSFNEQRELKQLEQEISKLESRKAELVAQMSKQDVAYAEIERVSIEMNELVAVLDDKSMRWLELSEFA